jgi:hypothetical protein
MAVQSNLDYPNLRCNGKCRVKVQIVVTCQVCACVVNLRRLVATRAPAAARLPSLVLTLKEVKETQGTVCASLLVRYPELRGVHYLEVQVVLVI